MTIIAQTNRLTIREFLPTDLETYLHHFTDDRVIVHLPKRSREERITIFNNALNQYPITKTAGIWGIYNKANGEFMGSCLLRPFENETGVLELGYSLDYKYWGQGIATEMANAIIAHGLNDNNIADIVAVTTLGNIPSQRVIEKAGLKRVDDLVRSNEVLAFFRLNGGQ
jgi:ribosomal-protein-alanine N-acetyltransferase